MPRSDNPDDSGPIGRVPPHNLSAEESLLGAMLLRREAIEAAHKIVTASDFYRPAHGHIYDTIVRLWSQGDPADPVTVAEDLKKAELLGSVGGPATLLTLQANCPATTAAPKYARIVAELAEYRRVARLASELSEAAFDMDDEAIGLASSAIVNSGDRLGELPGDVWRLEDFLNRPDADRPEWCIPGLVREGWRVMVVAGEGVGKTVLFRQIAMAAAQGIHPLHFGTMDPCRSLIVDLENPEDSVLDVCLPINERVKSKVGSGFDADRAWLWHRPSGINLRRRVDRVAFETVLATVKPQLVCMGPLYKAYEVGANENDEQAAREIMAVLDDLRSRYRFGLLLEHHAPKETAGAKRKLMPYGSSLWLRWPEIGINLYPEEQGPETLVVGRWRGDRLENEWPIKIHRSETWPWSGEWPDGYFRGGGGAGRATPSTPPRPPRLPGPAAGAIRPPSEPIGPGAEAPF